MNIAFLTPEYPHPTIAHAAGIGTAIKNLAAALVQQGNKVIVFVYGQDANEVVLDNGIEIHKIKHVKYRFLGWYLYRKHIQQYLNRQIHSKKIDLIEAPDWTGITAFMHLKCPLVIRLHGTDAYFCNLEGRKQKFKNYLFEKIALQSANAIVSVSAFTAKKTKALFGLNKSIQIIHNGVKLTDFEPMAEVAENETPTILYFGTLIRKKGVLALAEIFNKVVEQVPNVQLQLVGKDVMDVFEHASTYQLFEKRLTTEAKKQVVHIPQVPYAEVKVFLQKATVVVLPSFAEAFPMTWLEAMAMGKALVTSNIGWASEVMIDGTTGYTEHPTNFKAYANKIVTLLTNKNVNCTFGKQAKAHIETNFSHDKICFQNLHFYKSLL